MPFHFRSPKKLEVQSNFLVRENSVHFLYIVFPSNRFLSSCDCEHPIKTEFLKIPKNYFSKIFGGQKYCSLVAISQGGLFFAPRYSTVHTVLLSDLIPKVKFSNSNIKLSISGIHTQIIFNKFVKFIYIKAVNFTSIVVKNSLNRVCLGFPLIFISNHRVEFLSIRLLGA